VSETHFTERNYVKIPTYTTHAASHPNGTAHAGSTIIIRKVASKLLIYKAVLKSIWTYGIKLWGRLSNSNIEILQRFQSKALRSILNAPWYINSHRIHEDLQMNTVLSEIKIWSAKYFSKLENHTNALAVNLLDNSETTHRLKRYSVLTQPDKLE
jgi:hypothetical protein